MDKIEQKNKLDIYNLNKIEKLKKELALIILQKIEIDFNVLPYILKNMKINENEFKNYISLKESKNFSFYYEVSMYIKKYNDEYKKRE